MTSAGDSPGPDQLDPAYDGLFRPEDLIGTPAGQEAPAATPQPPAPEPRAPEPPAPGPAEAGNAEPGPAEPGPGPDQPVIAEPAPAPVATPAVAARQPQADTGRLFRSQGVADRPDTVLALDAGRFSRLRTLERTDTRTPPDPSDTAVAALLLDSAVDASIGEPMPSAEFPAEPGRRLGRRKKGPRAPRTGSPVPSGRGASGLVISLLVILVTVAVGFADAILSDGDLGWPTGAALLLTSAFGAFAVRRDADSIAFLIPPVAFLIATLTAGQLFLDSGEGSLVNRAVIVFFTLAANWIWILGSTLAALIIVLVRRRRS